jgi:hypothetical protein
MFGGSIWFALGGAKYKKVIEKIVQSKNAHGTILRLQAPGEFLRKQVHVARRKNPAIIRYLGLPALFQQASRPPLTQR